MESKKSVVSSFDVDHLTLKEGLYLRSVYRINDTLAVHSWDMRFRAPMAHAPLGSGEVHTIEHLMAYYLRLDPVIGPSVVSFCPMGCKTGFYLSTMNNVDAEQIRAALARVYNPGLYAVASTNEAMAQYMRCLYTREQAEEAGIGSIYNYEW